MKKVLVIGSSEYALANALYLQSRGSRVTLLAEELFVQQYHNLELVIQDPFIKKVINSNFELEVVDTVETKDFDFVVFANYGICTREEMEQMLNRIAMMRADNRDQFFIIRDIVYPEFFDYSGEESIAYIPKSEPCENIIQEIAKTQHVIGCYFHYNTIIKNLFEFNNVKVLNLKEAAFSQVVKHSFSAINKLFFQEVEKLCSLSNISFDNVTSSFSKEKFENPKFGLSSEILPLVNYLSNNPNTPLISSIEAVNESRQKDITVRILALLNKTNTVVFYRLATNPKNLENCNCTKIANSLANLGVKVLVFEPMITVVPDWLDKSITVIERFDMSKTSRKAIVVSEQLDLFTATLLLRNYKIFSPALVK